MAFDSQTFNYILSFDYNAVMLTNIFMCIFVAETVEQKEAAMVKVGIA